MDWEAEAKFWKRKYFEHLLHSTQVITALNRPLLAEIQAANRQKANEGDQ